MSVRERPIIFSTDMVKAILDGRKTMTRRVIKHPKGFQYYGCDFGGQFVFTSTGKKEPNFEDVFPIKCPYGQARDRLWVREVFAIECNDGYQDVYRKPDNPLGLVRWHKDLDGCKYFECARYRASEPETILGDDEDGMKWKPSIHMPRWASRITLEITDVRVERLQEITEEEAPKEGMPKYIAPSVCGHPEFEYYHDYSKAHNYCTPRGSFKSLWNSLAKKGFKWEDDPHVWVISFRRIL